MQSDPQLVYSLEIKVLDLEQKVEKLEQALGELRAALVRVEDDQPVPLPEDVTDRIRDGENAVRVLRQYRLMTQKDLSELCGIRPNHISAIERGMSYGLKTAKRLADALDVPVDLLT